MAKRSTKGKNSQPIKAQVVQRSDVAKGKAGAVRTPDAINTGMAAAGMDSVTAYGPGRPLNPTGGYSQRPRAMDYPLSVNVAIKSRSTWGRTSFETLKAIIDAYDVARMCINHKIDELRSMEPLFVPLDGHKGHDIDMAIEAARAALEFPDRESPYEEWLSKLLENALRYDATPLYRRRNLNGDVIGFEVLDGPSIFPYVDEHGRRPLAPAPAYHQVIHGQVFDALTSDDVTYRRFRPQTDSPFGLAPIESILITANTDLRFQWHFLQMFTDGSVPAGFVELPPDVSSPDQVAEWQDYWDAMVLGDQAKLHQLIAVPNGTKIQNMRPEAFDSTFVESLAVRTCGAFGVVPQDIGLVKDVNRANGETQTDIQFRVNTLPWVLWLQGILTRYVRYDLGLPVQVNLDTGRDKEDRLAEAQAWKIGTEGGAVSVDEWRTEIYGLPVDNERPMPRFIFSPRTGPVPLASVLAIAGQINPETGAPLDDAPLATEPFEGAPGVLADKSPGGSQFKRAPVNPDEPQFPELEHPVPGSDVVGTKPSEPVIGDPGVPVVKPLAKEATAGITSATGISGHDLRGAVHEPDEDDEDESAVAKAAEIASFRRFAKGRVRAGKWRDFTFTTVADVEAHRLNDTGRATVRKAAGELVAAGLCVRAADTGRVLMLQRALNPTVCGCGEAIGFQPDEDWLSHADGSIGCPQLPHADPASGMWEFPGGHIEDGETAFQAAWREWQEETGCLIPADSTVGNVWASPNGIYQGCIVTVPVEAAIPIHARGAVINPDDPDGDSFEAVAWWDPAQLGGPLSDGFWRNPVVRAELSADLALVLEALQPSEVVGDPKVLKASSWRDSADKTPQHAFDLKLTDHYAPLISRALAAAFPESKLRAAISTAASNVAKAVDPALSALRDSAREVLASSPDTATLEATIRQMYADAYQAGSFAAGQQVGDAAVTTAGVSAVDWANWTPGDPAAALQAADGALGALLESAGITIDGITGSMLDQLGNAIGDGLTAGSSVDTIAASLSGIVSDPSRAEMIAHTESARAVTQATLDTYSLNGVGEWEWILSDNACPECEDAAAAGPYPVSDSGDQPPLHPRCRCSASPVADSVTTPETGGDANVLGDLAGLLEDTASTEEAAVATGDAVAAEEAESATAAADLTALSDNDLAESMATADEAQLDKILEELERRDTAAQEDAKKAERNAKAKERRDAKQAAAEAEKESQYDALITAGTDPDEAFTQVYGEATDAQRKADAIAQLRANGYSGKGFDELTQSAFQDEADRMYWVAEGDTNGYMLNKAAQAAGIDPRSLFTGPESRARKYASDELLEFWQQHGRITVDDVRAGLLGGKSRMASTGYWR